MSILLLAEHNGTELGLATRKAASAATQLGGEIAILVAGSGVQAVAEQAAKLAGVTEVLYADAPYYAQPLAEEIAPLILREARARNCSHVIAAATTTGKDIMPRASALLDAQQISDVTNILSSHTFTRPIYAGNAFETVQSTDECKVLTVRAAVFDAAGETGTADVTKIDPLPQQTLSRYISHESASTGRPELGAARVVISGGRGLGSKENFALLEKLADKLNAALGASRAAVDAGYAPNDWQVGQTGKIVAPDLYIAVGISGAIQHVAGIKDSKVIVAINKDENAPIFAMADYGLVADLFTALPELVEALK